MRKKFIILLFAFVEVSWEANASQISCESFGNVSWPDPVGTVKTCFMPSTTSIDSEEIKISPKDETVQGLSFTDNKKINFLPVKVNETFPSLVAYLTCYCSLTTITKANFAGLNKLKILNLQSNQIATINSETFEDLIALKWLDLDHNKIKSMNGRAFAGLNQLTDVDLRGNVCINGRLKDQTRIVTIAQVVNSKCAFSETLTDITHSLDDKFKVLEIFMTKTLAEKEELQNELSAAKFQTASKAAELKSALDAKAQAEAQTKFAQDICKELDAQHKKICTVITQDLRDNFEFNSHVIEELLAENRNQSAEINEKNQKIKNLEEKVTLLANNGEC